MKKRFKTNSPAIYIVHFNDVYDLEESKHEPVGGASRFVTAVKQLQKY